MSSSRGRLIAVAIGCLSALAWAGDQSAGAAPVGVPVYTVTSLTPGMSAVGLGINATGDVAGWITVSGLPRPILRTPENGVIVLPTSSVQPYGIARDLSDRVAGVITVVGEARLNSSGSAIHAVRWKVAVPQGSVTVTDLGTLPGHAESFANGVNNSGQVTGTSDPNSFLSIGAFLYSDATGMVDLGLGSVGVNAVALDLNASGVVTGYLGLQAFRWSSAGGLQPLGAPAGWADSFGYAINAAGQVAGSAGSASGNAEVVVRYTDGTGWKILGGAGEHNQGNGINAWGDVVGAQGGSAKRALIYTDNLRLLAFIDDLLLVAGRWQIKEAYDINDAQQITGWGIDRQSGIGEAVLLTPVVPPPPNQPPVASFTTSCSPSLFCSFDGSNSTDDRGVLAWTWTVGSQTIGNGKFIGVQYATPQTINLTLTVTDSRGATNALTKPVAIVAAPLPPVAAFTVNCGPAPTYTCTLDGSGSKDADGSIVAYKWTNPLGQTVSTSVTYTRSFPRKGDKGAYTLVVTDNSGLTGSVTQRVVVL